MTTAYKGDISALVLMEAEVYEEDKNFHLQAEEIR